MVRIAISQAAFDAIVATLPVGSAYENATNEKGERMIWLEGRMLDKEIYSDVILRLAAGDRSAQRGPPR